MCPDSARHLPKIRRLVDRRWLHRVAVVRPVFAVLTGGRVPVVEYREERLARPTAPAMIAWLHATLSNDGFSASAVKSAVTSVRSAG
jgi:hypothetical protein